MPIPHTAIIPRTKDQTGESLGTFVQENFLTRAVVEDLTGWRYDQLWGNNPVAGVRG